METQEILDQLTAERDRIDTAIQALEGTTGPKRGRKPGKAGRKMSAAGRARISKMMKKRWAERKKAMKAQG